MAAWSKEWISGRSHVEIAGPNRARNVQVCLLGMLSFDRGLCDRADPSCRGIPPSLLCLIVWSRMLNNEAADARTGLLRHRKKETELGVLKSNMKTFLYFSVFATCLSLDFYTTIFYAVFRRLGTIHTFRSIFLIYCTQFSGTF